MNLEYETDRLILKVLKPSTQTAEKILDFYLDNRELFEKYEPERSQNFYTVSHQKTLLSCEYNLAIKLSAVRFWIYEKNAPDKIIGTICFRSITRLVYDCCETGYKFDERFWHNGYAREAMELGISVMFDDLKLHRITANVMPDNYASIRLLEHLGFENEGVERKSIRIRGHFEDHIRYSLLNPIPEI